MTVLFRGKRVRFDQYQETIYVVCKWCGYRPVSDPDCGNVVWRCPCGLRFEPGNEILTTRLMVEDGRSVIEWWVAKWLDVAESDVTVSIVL